jgi:hypothetical protein
MAENRGAKTFVEHEYTALQDVILRNDITPYVRGTLEG